MPTHDLQNESTGMRRSSGINAIDSFTDPLKSSRCTNGHIRQGHIIVDGSDHTDDFEVTMLFRLFGCDST